MVDKIVISDGAIIFTYTTGAIKKLTCPSGEERAFLRWFLTPNVLDYGEFKSAVNSETEDTISLVLPLTQIKNCG